MTTKRRPLLVVVAVLGACVLIVSSVFVVRGLVRWHSLHSFIERRRYARERIAVEPKTEELAAIATVRPVNLGYASFDTGSTSSVESRSQGDGAFVVVVYDGIHVGFLPPFVPGGSSALPDRAKAVSTQDGRKYPQTMRYVQQMVKDPLAAEVAVEATSLLPFSKIVTMNKDEFLAYSLKLREKGSHQRGLNEVRVFETRYVKGIERIGDSTTDRRVASVVFTSRDGTRCVGMHVGLEEGSSQDIAAVLDPILRSFRFTVKSVEDRAAVKALILHAGIQPEDNSQQNGAANGSQPIRSETNRTSSAAGSRR
jgi:hypothetical protein